MQTIEAVIAVARNHSRANSPIRRICAFGLMRMHGPLRRTTPQYSFARLLGFSAGGGETKFAL